MVAAPSTWTPESWKSKVALQQPVYESTAELDEVVRQIAGLPPLVTSWEIADLQAQLAEAADGKRFILQGGDCAERFADCVPQLIANKMKILMQMSLVLVHGTGKPVIRMGRFAGQYSKPRSDDFETQSGVTLPSYRGDNINRPAFTPGDRRADPALLLRGYERAALTLNFVRSLARGGFADLHHPEYWNLEFARDSPQSEAYHQIVKSVTGSLRFMENVLGVHSGQIRAVDFFTCHEALHLHYEHAQTHEVPHRPGYFNLSTHFPWIGMRTAAPDGAHVEYFRGIANPIGIKIGPSCGRDQLLHLLDILHPVNEPGRLTLIHRLGCDRIEDHLPRLIEIVRSAGKKVVWVCDPMHGNTRMSAVGVKTRRFDDILRELELAIDIHASTGSYLGGVHFELTGEDVTECVGGASGVKEDDLRGENYRSEVDPRLNYNQSLEMALLVARKLLAR